ncbi:MAG: aminopeptidase P family protein [Defluviitaleaceae bacterium]|nr:aminopeptidase P family protein [Defluviitaleaceae bacterium]
MKDFYIENRKKFGDVMENGSMLVVFTGAAPVKRGAQFYDFVPQRNFLYMTGIVHPFIAFMMKKNEKGEVSSKLYLERYCDFTAKWEGATMLPEEAEEISGIDSFGYMDELEGHIAKAFVRERINHIYLDLENRSLSAPNTPDLDLAAKVREKFPVIKLTNAHPLFGGLRLVKTAYEVENIKKAAKVSGEGFYAFMTNVKAGMLEYELEAHWDYICKKNGMEKAFPTILASGGNATVLHYNDNNCAIADGDLVLVDFGAAHNWYSSDLSRTFPVNGKFTARQRELYDIVLGALKKVIDIAKPGLKFSELNETVKAYYREHLVRIGLIKGETDEALNAEIGKYYYHGVSHMLGLETHDIGAGSSYTSGELTLEPGMVITVEPGLYISEEKIGIRIEDDVLITAGGCEVLTKDIIREADDIEAYMAKR